MITFIPLSTPYAASDSSSLVRTKLEPNDQEIEQPKALAYLLQMDDVRVLIDCGSPEDFVFATSSAPVSDDMQNVKPLEPESSTMARERAEDLEHISSGPLDEILAKLAPTIDLVLLSHSTLSHLGLYAYAYAKLGLRCLVYATMPVQSMGKLTVTEAVEALRGEVDIEKDNKLIQAQGHKRCLATLDEVEEAFEQIKTVRYLQPTHLEGKCTGLTLTAYSAGHSLGGAIWKIRSPTSGTVLVALDWNHNRERHLDGTALLSSSGAAAPSAGGAPGGSGGISDAVRRPDLLITEVQRGLVVNVRRKDRDAALLDLVHKTIQSGHSVLFPVDPSARLLELLVLLNQHWAYAYPHAKFPLCLVSRSGKEVVERSRTYMEWMTREWATKAGEAAADDKQQNNKNIKSKAGGNFKNQAPSSPLDFKFLRIFPSLAALDDAVLHDQAKVVLAVPPSMTHGPSRRLFTRFAQNPNDLIVLMQRGQPGSLSRWLWDAWNGQQESGFSWSKGKLGNTVSPQTEVQFELKSKVPLEGEELRAYLEAEKEKQAAQRALLERSRRRLEADEDDQSSDEDDSDSDEDDEANGLPAGKVDGGGFAEPGSMGRKRTHGVAFEESGGRGGGANGMMENDAGGQLSAQVSFDIYLKGNASRATSFFGSKQNQEGPFGVGVRYRLFPVVERKRRVDGYGETVDVARWLSCRRQIEAADEEGVDKESEEAQRRKAQGAKVAAAAPPSKFTTEQVSVKLRCRLAFIEMEGLNDGRALKTLIPQMHPRRLIMVNGDAGTRSDILLALSTIKSMSKEVYAPAWRVTVQIGELTNSYTVNLGEGLLTALQMSRFEDYEVGHVKGALKFGAESMVPILEFDESGITETDSKQQSIGSTLFVGDLKLSTLKSALSGPQFRLAADFAGEGMLVCGAQIGVEAVTVKKENQGRIVIEGNVGRSFRNVRKAVYGLHAKVVGQ